MSRFLYYQMVKALAREKRKQYEITGYRISLSNIKKLCKQEGIASIEYNKFKGIRGAYFNDEFGTTIVVKKDLPEPQKIFTIIHELKHHLLDRGIEKFGCTYRNENTEIEIGAEIFAVEFIFPDNDFTRELTNLGISKQNCTPENVVKFKHETNTILSYSSITKRLIRLDYADNKSFEKVKWVQLEESIYGEPIYKKINRFRKKHKKDNQ